MVCYALTSFISGYLSGGLYARNWYGKNWMKTNDLESIIVCIYVLWNRLHA
uniref:Transmembrane 9 superfamily member n=1 Tax=Musa acuminata subsp. malaccensis TaxID=214687 RepID=A0A804KUV5_MUSAM